MGIFDDLYHPRRLGPGWSPRDLADRLPVVEWNPPLACDWPICFEFYPDFHDQEPPPAPSAEAGTLDLGPKGVASYTTVPFDVVARRLEPGEERPLGVLQILPFARIGTEEPAPVTVAAFYELRTTQYRFEFRRPPCADSFSIAMMAGPRELHWGPDHRAWQHSEPLLRMFAVLARAFEAIMAGMPEAMRTGALVRVGYPHEKEDGQRFSDGAP